MDVLPVAAEVEDRVEHELAGPVVRHLSAALGPVQLERRRVGHQVGFGAVTPLAAQ